MRLPRESGVARWSSLRLGFFIFLLGGFFFSGWHGLEAAWLRNGTPICTPEGVQQLVGLVPDGAGGVIVLGNGYPGTTEYFVQRFTPDGVVASGWGVCGAVVDSSFVGPDYRGFHPLQDGNGGLFVLWNEDPYGGDSRIFLTRIASTGEVAPDWPADGRNVGVDEGSSSQGAEVFVPDSVGGVLIAWQEPGEYRVLRVQSNGANADGWPVRGRVVPGLGWLNGETTTTDGSGGMIVAWALDPSRPAFDIYAQRITIEGAAAWNSVASVCTANGPQTEPAIASDGAGGAIIAWRDGREHRNVDSLGADIYAQRIDPSGLPLWTPPGVAINADTTTEWGPENLAIVPDGASGALIFWREDRGQGTEFDIYGQHVDAAGSITWPPNGLVICDMLGMEGPPAAAPDGSGGAYVAWGSSNRVHATHITSAGEVAPACWSACGDTIASGAWEPLICSDGFGGAFVAWTDPYRGDVYLARLAPCRVVDVGQTDQVLSWTARIAALHPNPTRGPLELTLEVGRPTVFKAEIVDVAGRIIHSWSPQHFSRGRHSMSWDGRGRGGVSVPSGLYLFLVRDEKTQRAAKFVVRR